MINNNEPILQIPRSVSLAEIKVIIDNINFDKEEAFEIEIVENENSWLLKGQLNPLQTEILFRNFEKNKMTYKGHSLIS